MPTVHREAGFRFFFFSNERNEPPHIHVEKADGYAKLWLKPLCLVEDDGFTAAELRKILTIATAKKKLFLGKWNEFFAR